MSVWHPMSGYDPQARRTVMVSGEGCWVTDDTGRRYLDAKSGLWCVNAGYGRDELADAARDQLRTLPYYPLTDSHLPAQGLAARLGEWLGGDYVFFFSNSGSEANEVAFKIARQYHQQCDEPYRQKIVSSYRAEPVISGGGVIVPPAGYLAAVAAICARSGALLIVDEAVCGFGRTGRRFGHQHSGIVPDIVTMAKAVANGYFPIAVTAVRREIHERFAATGPGRLRHINTFGGHPAACAVALRTMDIMDGEDLPARAAANSLPQRLKPLLALPQVGEVRGLGLLAGVELVEDRVSRRPVAADVARRVVEACRERGVIVGMNANTAAGLSNVVMAGPPLVAGDDELDLLATTLERAIKEVA